MLQDFCYWAHIDSYNPLIVDDTAAESLGPYYERIFPHKSV